MDLGLKGKIAIVGGSSEGLGKACALALSQEGAKVVISARREEPLRKTAKEIQGETGNEVLAVPTDLSKAEDIKNLVSKTVEKFNTVHILINNTGGPSAGNFSNFNDKDWQNAFDLVLMSVIRTTREVLPHMQKQKWGRILNLTSLTPKQPYNDLILSGVFRSGILNLTKSLSNELTREGILVNDICMGWFDTKRANSLLEHHAEKLDVKFEEYKKKRLSSIPLGRMQDPMELGYLAAFLCSERASSITGTHITLDGGELRGV